MGMWDEDCSGCDGGLRPWGSLVPPGTPDAIVEVSAMDVGNRNGVLETLGSPLPQRVREVFGRGLGQLAEDVPPPIDANPGAPGSDTGGDSGGNPAVDTSLNPMAATTAGAQTGTNTNGLVSNGGGGGGGGDITGDTSGPDYVPWVIGGALVLAAGVGAAVYLKRRRR
jgi:hypothetical protein